MVLTLLVRVFKYHTLSATIVVLVCPFFRVVVSGYAQVAIASLYEYETLCCCLQKERVYVFVRFGKQYILPMRNSLTTNLSVLKNYHGRILGIGECVSTNTHFTTL